MKVFEKGYLDEDFIVVECTCGERATIEAWPNSGGGATLNLKEKD